MITYPTLVAVAFIALLVGAVIGAVAAIVLMSRISGVSAEEMLRYEDS